MVPKRTAENAESVVERFNANDARSAQKRAGKRPPASRLSDGTRKPDALRFEALSSESLDAAKKLSNAAFALEGDASGNDLEASLAPRKAHQEPESEYTLRTYWVARDASGEVVGITGLYGLKGDRPSHCWLGWFALKPALRGRELGKTMLEFTLGEARTKGKKDLYIVSSDHPDMAGNAKFYHRNGCPVVAVLNRSGIHLGSDAGKLPESVVRSLHEHYPAFIDAGVNITLRRRRIDADA